jgi:hypothetical protein
MSVSLVAFRQAARWCVVVLSSSLYMRAIILSFVLTSPIERRLSEENHCCLSSIDLFSPGRWPYSLDWQIDIDETLADNRATSICSSYWAIRVLVAWSLSLSLLSVQQHCRPIAWESLHRNWKRTNERETKKKEKEKFSLIPICSIVSLW